MFNHYSQCVNFSISLPLPVRRYPPLSNHQYNITQLSGPQVALHLAESYVSMAHSSEHTVLWLHWHTRGQCCTAVRCPARHRQTQKGINENINTQSCNKSVSARWFSFVQDRETAVLRELHQLLCYRIFLYIISSHVPALLHFLNMHVARSIQKLCNGPITRSEWQDNFSPLEKRICQLNPHESKTHRICSHLPCPIMATSFLVYIYTNNEKQSRNSWTVQT